MTASHTPAAPRRHRLRRLVTGQAGPASAWSLAAVTLIATVVAVAGPREAAAGQAGALRQELAHLTSLDTDVTVTGQWQPYAGQPHSMLTPAQSSAITTRVAAAMRPPLDSPASRRWTGAATPAGRILNPARKAVYSRAPPVIEVVSRSGLAAHSHLVSGSLPTTVTPGRRPAAGQATPACPTPAAGRAGQARVVTVGVAVTAATASTLGLHPGSLLGLCPYQGGDPAVTLQVTGVVRPARPASAYWQDDPTLAAPDLTGPARDEYWTAGALAAPGELAALQAAYSGATFQGTWAFPLDLREITPSALPSLLAGIARVSNDLSLPQFAPSMPFTLTPATSCGIAPALSGFLARQHAVAAIGSLLVTGLSVAGLVLLAVCAGLAAAAHRPELALARARGASIPQVAARLLGRTCCVTVPAVAAGAVLAVVATPAGATMTSWWFGGATALTAIAGPAVAAAWTHRRAGPGTGGGHAAATVPAPRLARLRRAVAELAVLAAAAGSVAALRQRGVVTGADPYLSACPALVAAAAALVAARACPPAIRALLPAASARRGAAGFVGLARAARSGPASVLPALTLVLTLALAAFAATLSASVAAGQVAHSWRQVGADVAVQAPGDTAVSAADRRAVAAVPGIQATAAVYASGSQPQFAPRLTGGPAGALTPTSGRVGLVIVDPARYAALAAGTPWPHFPAGLLARPRPGAPQQVPLLASGAAARAAGHSGLALVLDGIRLPVTIVGRVGDTPAMPSGGSYVVMPGWARSRFPSIAGPDELLATGAAAGPALRSAVAAAMPGAQVTLRRQVLAALAASPAQSAGSRLQTLAIWAAAALSAVAVVFALAASAGERSRLLTRLTALGMSRRQARWLALADTLPLLSVAVAGMVAATGVLALLVGPVLNLAVFTGAAGTAPVHLSIAAAVIPAAGSVIWAVAVVAAEQAIAGWRDVSHALRQEEGG